MGSFGFSCAISGLGIEGGEPVRAILLTKTSNKVERGHSIIDNWAPRTFPLAAEYNSYGSIENLQSGILQDLWLRGIARDLVEKGPGDNTSHDVATRRNMNIEELLTALWECRVEVEPYSGPKPSVHNFGHIFMGVGSTQISGPVGTAVVEKAINYQLPTLSNIEKILKDAGMMTINQASGEPDLIVDEEFRGSMRVRQSGYGECSLDKLNAAAAAISKYFAAMVTCGSGNYAKSAEILVRPRPGISPRGCLPTTIRRTSEDAEQRMSLSLALVREDVWQALLRVDNETRPEYYAKLDIAKIVKDRWLEDTSGATAIGIPMSAMFRSSGGFGIAYGNRLQTDDRPKMLGLGTSWSMAVEQAPHLKPAEVSAFLQSVTEFLQVEGILAATRYRWAPSSCVGPQFAEREVEAAIAKEFASIAEKLAVRDDAESDDEDSEA